MADQFVGEIRAVGFNFPPTGWAYCNGQLMPISQNTALFSLLGTFYGGDGKSTFALPNLQGNVPINAGQGPGLTDRFIGESGGSANVTLLTTEMPQHTHGLGAQNVPLGSLATPSATTTLDHPASGFLFDTATPNQPMAATAITPTGGSQPHNNLMPFLVLNFVIALQGIFPSRA